MIDAAHVEFSYEEGRLALGGIDLHVQPGEFICLLGGNGSGKSTLAKHINALLIPDSGKMIVDGLDTADSQTVYRIRSTAGMVFQNPDDQLIASLVEDDVAFGPENLGIENPLLRKRVDEALSDVGLAGFEQRETHTLSGGQKQRVAIAGALAMQPRILILDEASAMLDPRGSRDLMHICKKLHKRGMTIVMITHSMEEAAEADRVVVLDRGKIAHDGTPQEVLSRKEILKQMNLDIPFACSLAQMLRENGLDIPLCVREQDLIDALMPLLLPACKKSVVIPASQTPAPMPARPSKNTDMARPAQAERITQPVERSTNEAPVVSFEHVSFTYDPPAERKHSKKTSKKHSDDPIITWAIHDISFDIKQGEFFGIAGHTGSGKSTLIQQMNGILQPTEGRVCVQNKDISDKHEAASIRTDVGVVFQYPEHQLFADSVYNDVAFGPRNLALSKEETDVRVRESLQLVQLDFDEVHSVSPFTLSGGQQRRVALAGVLAMRPSVLVLDEPVAGLDPAGRQELLELISSLHTQGRTVVMISHRMDDLAQYCDRMLILNKGESYALGTPNEVFLLSGDLTQIGLELPAPQRMANALRAQGVPLPSRTMYDAATLARALAYQAKS